MTARTRAAVALAALSVCASGRAGADEPRWFLHVGPLVAVGAHAGGPGAEAGLGLEATAGVPHQTWSLGGFAQVAGAGPFDRVRVDAGAQATLTFVGLEAGAGYEQGDGAHAATVSLHLAPFLAAPLPVGGRIRAFASVAFRADVGLAAVGAGARFGSDFAAVFSVKLPLELLGDRDYLVHF